jgi:hypothetical protein
MRCFDKALGAAALAVMACALPAPASAQLFLNEPDFKAGPIEGSDPLVGLPIPGATAQEYSAHLLWNLRAGLNVAALQCQFSPYLRAVDNYNGILGHHGKELMSAYNMVGSYFKRKFGPKAGQTKFDDYSTMTYNGFSTLQAQYGFCQIASDIAKEALGRPKGQMHLTAQGRLRELRNSLVPAYDRMRYTYNPQVIRLPTLPPLDQACYDKKNRLKKKCLTLARR